MRREIVHKRKFPGKMLEIFFIIEFKAIFLERHKLILPYSSPTAFIR